MPNVMRIGIIAAAFIAASGSVALAQKKPKLTAEDFIFEHVSCTGAPNEIRIIVSGVKKDAGIVTADLFPNDEDGFLHRRGRIDQVTFAAKAPMTKFCIQAPEAGLFAMSAYHDLNANEKFDKTGIGLPAEPWGISNNPKVMFAPPPVEKALFEVGEGKTPHINIDLN